MSAIAPVFMKAAIYQSKTHGLMEFQGLDEYCGEVTFQFRSITSRVTTNVLPDQIGFHFDQPLAKCV